MTFQHDRDPSEPGVSRGPCSPDSGDPDDVEDQFANSQTHFSKIRVRKQNIDILVTKHYNHHQIGCLGCTYPGGEAPHTTPAPPPAPTTTQANNNCPGGSLQVSS